MAIADTPRILYVKQILERFSDEQHPMAIADINRHLYELCGQTAHRGTLTKDIAALCAFGMDIITVHSTQNRYFVGSRLFETPELRLLIDAIHSSKCLTEKKSRQLIDKLATFTSVHQAAALAQHPLSPTLSKPTNEQVYYIIDAIHEAIDRGRKIRFQYLEYTPEKEHVLRGDGEEYMLSPYACLWNGDYYYVIGWSDKRDKEVAFRVDRIAHTPTVTEEALIPPPAHFDVQEYASAVFRMFQGEPATVELLCDNELMKTVIDRFGSDVFTQVVDDTHFRVVTSVSLSPTFYGWIFSFAGKIRLLSPQKAIDDYRTMLTVAI